MRSLLQLTRTLNCPPKPWQIAAIVAVVLISNATLLDDFWRLLQTKSLGVAAWDTATHYFRMLQTRELYLPSGHRFGWEPFWFQGYVPFLLYPHLTYVLLALASYVVPVEPPQLFNFYILAVYLALPLGAGLLSLRPLGAVPAIILTAWLSTLSTTGAGLSAAFFSGLLSQQAGVVLFTCFTIELLASRRLDRAAIWLGLIPLVHVHASLVAGAAWLCLLVPILTSPDRSHALRQWLSGSILAALIALPTLSGLFYGWENLGGKTTFPEMPNMVARLFSGKLLAPTATLVALAGSVVATLVVAFRGPKARYLLFWLPLAVCLFLVAAYRLTAGVPLLDRVLETMLYLRTFPFAFAWTAVGAVCLWPGFPRGVRVAIALFTLLGLLWPRHEEAAVRRNIGSVWRTITRHSPQLVSDYRSALRWIVQDVGKETTTIALAVPRPSGSWLLEATTRCSQPLLGGHGVELTSTNNNEIIAKTEDVSCEEIRRQVEDYAIGYMGGTDSGRLAKLTSCLELQPSFEQGSWWVIATGKRWDTATPFADGFSHNATWTELEWNLKPTNSPKEMRLPIAANSRWVAEIDAEETPISTTHDQMMVVQVPAGAAHLRLSFQGYPGEWATVVLSAMAFGAGAIRSRRATRSVAEITHTSDSIQS